MVGYSSGWLASATVDCWRTYQCALPAVRLATDQAQRAAATITLSDNIYQPWRGFA